MECFTAIVSGRVQGVMYRDFASRKAHGLALSGSVENLPDGTVRVVAEGERMALDAFLAKLRRGPLLARVENVSVSYAAATGAFKTFHIIYESHGSG